MDIVGPLPPSKKLGSAFTTKQKYIVTVNDRVTRWFKCIPCEDITAGTVAEIVFSQWMCQFRVPLCITTDQRRHFESKLMGELSKEIRFHRLRRTSYHPKANVMNE